MKNQKKKTKNDDDLSEKKLILYSYLIYIYTNSINYWHKKVLNYIYFYKANLFIKYNI